MSPGVIAITLCTLLPRYAPTEDSQIFAGLPFSPTVGNRAVTLNGMVIMGVDEM